jgi:hypothetical protein
MRARQVVDMDQNAAQPMPVGVNLVYAAGVFYE